MEEPLSEMGACKWLDQCFWTRMGTFSPPSTTRNFAVEAQRPEPSVCSQDIHQRWAMFHRHPAARASDWSET